MKYLASNDNEEYAIDEISLLCEVGCDFTLNSKNTEMLNNIMNYVRTLPSDQNFMNELGESFVTLIHKYVAEFSEK